MTVRDQIFAAARQLAQQRPINKINLTDVAKAAGVSWPTVRRYMGNKQQLREFLVQQQPQDGQHPVDTRSRILQSAKRVFARQGYAGATLDAIAADAGMTKGAVYWHFTSKSDLFLALLEDQLQSPLSIPPERAKRAFEESISSQEAVTALLTSQLAYAQDHPDWCRLYLEFMVQSREADVQKVLSGIAAEERQAAIMQLIQQMQTEGILREDVDPIVIAKFWGALVDGMILKRIVDPQNVDLAAWAEQIAQLLWGGLRPQEQ
jgi:AcrR family transcriptional regulator